MAERTIVLFGGPSSERRVSVASGQNVASVLEDAEPWFLSPQGRVHAVRRDELAAFARPFETDFAPASPPAFASIEAALDAARGATFFLALHGTFGEDGTLQRLLEARRLAFTGPGADASAKAFDKEIAKRVAAAAGVRIVESVVLDRASPRPALETLLRKHGRVVAKPVAGGSSVGLHHLRNERDLDAAAAAIAASSEAYLAEAFVAGTELTIGVVDGDRGARALPASEVRVDPGRAFDFEGKYLGKGTTEITPAEVPAEVSRAAQELALAAHRALGCQGYSRTDVIVGPQGPVFLELNTLPGLTRASFIPQQLAAEGTSLRSFLDGQLALSRMRRDRQA